MTLFIPPPRALPWAVFCGPFGAQMTLPSGNPPGCGSVRSWQPLHVAKILAPGQEFCRHSWGQPMRRAEIMFSNPLRRVSCLCRRAGVCSLALSLVLLGGITRVAGAEPPADLVVWNAKILTVNPQSSIVEAAAVRDGRFVAVGSSAEVKKLSGARTRVIDARGRMVVPGLIETHVHAIGVARDEAVQPFVQLSSIAEMQEWVRERGRTGSEGEWIEIPRVDLTRLREGRLPTRTELDAAAPQRPVVFNWQYGSRQIQVLNTAALRAAQITRDTAEPAGGRTKILKNAQGEPTGVLENPGSLTSKFRLSK